MIPAEKKTAYNEAKRLCPDVVQIESKPLRFLLYNGFDIWKSAEQIIHYWEFRRETFGPDRAFRPLHITGNGALTPQDVAYLSSGFISVTPPNCRDGLPLFCYVPAREPKEEDYDAHCRCHFYFIQLLLEVLPLSTMVYHCIG